MADYQLSLTCSEIDDTLVNLNQYVCDSSEVDQGVAGDGKTLYTYIEAIGTTKNATIYLLHDPSAGNTTTYTLTTSESLPDNINIVVQPGAIIDGAGTLTLDRPEQISASKSFRIFGSSITIVFTHSGEVFSKWWQTGTYHNNSINAAITSLAAEGGTVTMPGGQIPIDDTILVAVHGICLRGVGGTGNNHAGNTLTTMGTVIQNKSGDSDAIDVGALGTYITDTVFRDFGIDGDADTATAGSGILLDSRAGAGQGVKSFKMYNVSISHADDYGLHINGNVFECAFFGCEFRFNDYAVYAETPYGNSAEISFHGCQFWQSTNYAFYRSGNVTDYSFHGCQFGINASGVYAGSAFSFHGCRFEDNTNYGIYCHGNNVQIFGALIDNSTTGIYIPNAVNTLVVGCMLKDNITDIDVGSATTNTLLLGLYNPDGEGDLVVTNAARSTQFLDNHYEILTAAGAALTYGITELNSTAGAMAITLGDGTAIGQQKKFYFITDGGDVTLTIAKHEDGAPSEVLYFRDAGDYLTLEWSYQKWHTIINYGVETS